MHRNLTKKCWFMLDFVFQLPFLIFINPRYKYIISPSFISRYYSYSLISHITSYIIMQRQCCTIYDSKYIFCRRIAVIYIKLAYHCYSAIQDLILVVMRKTHLWMKSNVKTYSYVLNF